MVFPLNNLPTQSRFWGREVEKKIVNLENSLRSSDINNTTRDSQLQVTATQAVVAANLAQEAAQEAADAAANASAAINGLGSLDDANSTYKINAANVTVGTLNAININGSQITGSTLQTAPSGRRVEIESTNTSYFDENNNFAGQINGFTSLGGVATLDVASSGSGSVRVFGSGVTLRGAAESFLSLNGNGCFVSRFNGVPINLITDGNIEANGNLSATGSMSSSSVSTGSISCSSVSSTGSISGTTVSSTNFSGTVNTSIANNTQTSFSGNLFINSSGNMFRNPTISSREAKEDIAPYTFDTEAFIAVEPVTFKYKDGVIANPDEAGMDHLGFILEDFEAAGVAEHLTIPANEIDVYKGLRYDKLYMMLHKVVQEQNKTIKELTARIEALESR